MGCSIISHINKRKDNMYLIIKQQNFGEVSPLYTVADSTDSLEKAEKKGEGYELINDDEQIQFHCVELKD